jgi:hypothetical protein
VGDFLFDRLWEFYISRRDELRRGFRIRRDSEVYDFCVDGGVLKYEYVCRLCMMFSGRLGERLPDVLHNALVMGSSNRWVEEYLANVCGLRPLFMGVFNLNRRRYTECGLGVSGNVRKYYLK